MIILLRYSYLVKVSTKGQLGGSEIPKICPRGLWMIPVLSNLAPAMGEIGPASIPDKNNIPNLKERSSGAEISAKNA